MFGSRYVIDESFSGREKDVPYIELKQVSPNDFVVLFIMSTISLWRAVWILGGGIKKDSESLIDELVLKVKVRTSVLSHLCLLFAFFNSPKL